MGEGKGEGLGDDRGLLPGYREGCREMGGTIQGELPAGWVAPPLPWVPSERHVPRPLAAVRLREQSQPEPGLAAAAPGAMQA